MRTLAIAMVAVAFGLLVAPPALACYTCDNECCVEAPNGSLGTAFCYNSQACSPYGCACFYCNQDGNFCEGSAPEQCEQQSPEGACLQYKSLLIPNGEAIDLPMLTNPPVATSLDRTACMA